MRNASAVLSVPVALAALAVLAGAAYFAQTRPDVTWLEAAVALPGVALIAFLALSLAARARARHQRTLGRVGGEGLARLARVLAGLALLVTLTAALALGVFAVLELTDGLTHAPW